MSKALYPMSIESRPPRIRKALFYATILRYFVSRGRVHPLPRSPILLERLPQVCPVRPLLAKPVDKTLLVQSAPGDVLDYGRYAHVFGKIMGVRKGVGEFTLQILLGLLCGRLSDPLIGKFRRWGCGRCRARTYGRDRRSIFSHPGRNVPVRPFCESRSGPSTW